MKILYFLMIVMLPFSAMIKIMMGWQGIYIEPSLILGFVLFVLMRVPLQKKEFFIFSLYITVTTIGFLNLSNYYSLSLYDIYNHSLRFLLLVFMMSVIVYFNKNHDYKLLTAKALLFSCWFQILFSVYTYLAWKGMIWFPNPSFFDHNSFDDRFSLPVFGMILPRFFGTTQEPAPFGLFGLCVLMFFLLNKKSLPYKQGVCLSLGIILVSLSDQIFLALIPIGIWSFIKTKNILAKIIIAPAAIILTFIYAYNNIVSKIGMISSGVASFGESAGERLFYLKYIIESMLSHIPILLLGYGGGLLGYQLNYEFGLPVTTSPMSIVADILASGGILFFILFSFYYISYLRIHFLFALSLIIANSLQHDWKSTSFFFALAVIRIYFLSKNHIVNPIYLYGSKGIELNNHSAINNKKNG
ncbi:hypothetical protein EDF88_2980 [Buttiauxella sp. BIGb0552]|uniref:hypothetical protein n=1 Tax=Buttiauxella sp. BIGb0552 TaxID=2485120 RepID=UPI001066398E|nr:hypothetical protein [Buttiauxella sp. BIGb0552]TDX16949.1 hypothetical protein EDF88_2980 [Buttiauxella sp. BIGb0552]